MLTTDRQLAALKPRDKVYWQAVSSPHGGGLALRVTPTGSKAWYHRYRFGGKADSLKLGRYPTMGLQEARQAHGEAHGLLHEGINPKRQQRQQRAENLAAWTMGELFDAWLPIYSTAPTGSTRRPPSEDTVKLHRWRWNRYLKKPLGDLLVRSMIRKLVSVEIATIAEGSRADARKCLSMLRAMFDFAEARGQIEENPTAGIQPSKVGATRDRPRERVLSIAELSLLWREIDGTMLHPSVAAALKMLILTGQRRGELVAMRWEDLDLEAGVWTIPAADTKAHRGQTVYLPGLAIGILDALPRKGDRVFIGRFGDPMSTDAPTKAVQRLRRALEIPSFTAHDLRRSVATGMAKHCGVQPHVIELVLNHAHENPLVGVYQRHDYAEEQRKAWQAWGELIEHQVARGGEKVVPIRA
ncbi:integrase [Halomonas ventosae]|uniref:Integrase n=1 Tax=Halomonas ventosae TaxID=229007 RepID=A0A4R6ZEH7_9GAMM|nr:site-specific integrase [Halomonas ventosae]TDR50214.1 integrase [Halomonas ventosae]